MTSTDLRIGNNIIIDGIVRTIDARTLFDFDHDSRVKEPIPLTEELLTNKLGCFLHPFFKQKRYCLPRFEECGVDLQLTVSDVGGFVLWLVNDGDTNGTALKIVRALHELQNAFHVFTNQELTLKQ